MKSILDRTALGLFKAVPARVARHALFLAQSQREIVDRWGYHIRPVHFYEPLPDFRAITEDQINRRRKYPSINFGWDEQLSLLKKLAIYSSESHANNTQNGFDFHNSYFAGFDAVVCYSLIRHLKPRLIMEIGGGYSTRIAHAALARNRIDGHKGKLTCIEPEPEPRLIDAKLDIELIAKPVQEIGVEFFSRLDANDILFIDSSHTVKFGSDVCYEFLDVLPTLKPGVWVHVHDIFFPHDYPAEWLLGRRLALNEQYLLEAFLSFNNQFAVRLANCWMCLDHPEAAAKIWPSDQSDSKSASSFWMERAE